MKLWLLVPLLLALAGCDAFRHVAECKRFVETTNTKLQSVQNEMATAPNAQSTAYFNISSHYSALRLELLRMTFRDPQLDKSVKRFAREVNALATETKGYADALQKRDLAKNDTERLAAEAQLNGVRERLPRIQESYGSSLDKVVGQCAPSK